MNRRSSLLITFAVLVAMAAPLFLGAPAAASAPPAAVKVEPGLMRSMTVSPARSPSPTDEVISVIVNLHGQTVMDEYRRASVSLAEGPDPVLSSRLATVQDTIQAAQEPAALAIEAAGATVVARYQVIRNGFLVHARRSQIADLARIPGVVEINSAPILTLDLAASVPHIEATRVWQELGFDGEGVTVAVIDTGVDYTHADLEGPGTPEDHAANDPRVVEDGSFPTGKVIGGHDLVGEIYSATDACTDPPPPDWDCTQVPEPDDDPLDLHAHGTHVSGIVAGVGVHDTPDTWKIGPGVAPAAKIVGLKVFGTPVGAPVTTDMADAAVEWVASSNLGLEVPGFGGVDNIGKIDVINMSLGSSFSGGMIEAERAVSAAVDAGVTVVASAGNSGAIPFITGSPAAASMALSVASSLPPGVPAFIFTANWMADQEVEILDLALGSGITGQVPVPEEGFEGDVAWFGSGCSADTPEQDVNEKIALIERGVCTFVEKLVNAQNAGATAAIVFTDDREPTTMGGSARSRSRRS